MQLLVLFPGWMSIISVGKMKELELEIIFLNHFSLPCRGDAGLGKEEVLDWGFLALKKKRE